MRTTTPFLPLISAQSAYGLLGGAYLPFFAASLTARGLDAASAGLLQASATLIRMLTAPLAGLLADAHSGHRAAMLLWTALALCAFAAFALSHAPGAIFLSGLCALVAWMTSSPILESITLRSAERAGLSYGRVRVWLSIAFVIGNVVSGFVIAQYGFQAVALWFAATALLQLMAVMALPRDPRAQSGTGFVTRFLGTLAEARELTGRPLFLLFLLVCSLIQGSHVFYYSYAGLIWRSQGIGPGAIGMLWPLGVLAEIALFIASGAILKRIHASHLLAIGAAACAFRWSVMAFDPPMGLLAATQFLHGLTFAIPHLGAIHFILRATPPRLSATAQSLYSVFGTGLGSSLALISASLLFGTWGSHVYLLMSAMASGAFFLALILGARWNGGQLTGERA